jgi:signal transduction histidine kinase
VSAPALKLLEKSHVSVPPHERLLEAQKDALEMIVRGGALSDTLAALCRIVEAQSEHNVVAAILLADESGRRLFTGAAPALPDSYNSAVDGIAISCEVGTCAAAAARNEVVITPDIGNCPRWRGLAHLPLDLGLVAAWSSPIVSAEGKVLGTFGTYFTELREPMPAERQLVEVLARTAALAIERQRNDSEMRRLNHNRARLDYAAQLSGVGFWHCVLPLDVLEWDARVKEHFFLPPDARVTIEDFFARLHPEDREPARIAIENALSERRSYDVVYRAVHPTTGNTKWIHALGGTAFAPDGTPTHFDGVTVDVTEQKRDQARLAFALARVSEQDRRKDEFLATLAHELRNPLAPISTGLSILKHGTTPEVQAKTREMMERQLRHLVHMVDDLLDISRVTLGKVTLKKEHVDFRTVLNSALEVARPIIENSRHEFAVRLPADPLPLDADPTRIAQVIANLLNNAAKYTPPGGRVELIAAREGDTLVIDVADSGVGIPADMLTRVFDMFTQVGRTIDRAQGGLGIGLTLVRGIVEMHGGTVTAASAGPGQGTVLSVRLPLATLEAQEAPTMPAHDSSFQRHRILVVDDNADAADSLSMLLGLEGHEMQVAHSGEQSLNVAALFKPDIVFLDIGLPGIDGYEVARRMRADTRYGSPRIVALTGWGTEDDRRQAHAAGFDGHLVKPVDPTRLAATLSAL